MQIKEGDYKLLEKVIWKSFDFNYSNLKNLNTIKKETLVSYD